MTDNWFIGAKSEADKWSPILLDVPGYDAIATRGDCRFDPQAAATMISFVELYCRHTEGPLAGERIELQRWQRAMFANLFGWKRPNGLRRYRRLFVFVPRKNGKTVIAGCLILCVAYCDSEGPGTGRSRLQINGAAGSYDQASLTFTYAAGMIAEEPQLARLARVYDAASKSIVRYATPDHSGRPLAVYKVLTKGGKRKHGLNTHLGIIDELHEFDDGGELVDVMTTSTGARAQPIVAFFTTSDFDRPESICNELHDYASRVRDGVLNDDSAREFLPIIYEAGPDDDWTDPKVWAKANPNLGVSLPMDYLIAECQDAQAKPRKVNTFRRLHLNIRTSTLTQWLTLESWDKCREDYTLKDLYGLQAWGGLDLASSRDLAAFVLVFPKHSKAELEAEGVEQTFRFWSWIWMPKENIVERSRVSGTPYLQWADAGLLRLTDGARIDYGVIRRTIREIAENIEIVEVGFDPWQAEQIAQELAEPADDSKPVVMVRLPQNAPGMNAPSLELETLVAERRIRHDGNAVMRYMIPNVQMRESNDGLIKPDRKHSKGKIDAVVALIMAIGRASSQAGRPKVSVYKHRGIIRL